MNYIVVQGDSPGNTDLIPGVPVRARRRCDSRWWAAGQVTYDRNMFAERRSNRSAGVRSRRRRTARARWRLTDSLAPMARCGNGNRTPRLVSSNIAFVEIGRATRLLLAVARRPRSSPQTSWKLSLDLLSPVSFGMIPLGVEQTVRRTGERQSVR
jgi:hypothetical protein